MNPQLESALAANRQLAADVQDLSASLGRMTAERDRILTERDQARGQVIALQQARATASRAVEQVRAQHRDAMAAKDKEHADKLAAINKATAADNTARAQKAAQVEKELAEAKETIDDLNADLAMCRKMLEKYEPQMREEKARAELAKIEAEERSLKARRKAAMEVFGPVPAE